jgi:hypothetical protein
MPFDSKRQARYFHWADEHPAEAAKRGLKPAVVQEFISAQHGHSTKNLPERAEHKNGGFVRAPSKW